MLNCNVKRYILSIYFQTTSKAVYFVGVIRFEQEKLGDFCWSFWEGKADTDCWYAGECIGEATGLGGYWISKIMI